MNTNITRVQYRVVTAIAEPFVAYNSSDDSFYGYCIDLLNALQEISGFDYEIRESYDKDFGHRTSTGEWTGMIRELLQDTADVAVGALWITHPRRQAVDFTVPFYEDNGLTIMMRKRDESTVFLWFLTIFDPLVWVYFAATYLITSILLCLYERYSPFSYRNAPMSYGRVPPDRRFASLSGCFWFCLTTLTPANSGPLPRNLSGKLVAAVWWLFVYIIVAAYSANLAAYQALYKLERHIETIDDLRRQYQVDYTTIADSPTHRYFKWMKDNEELLSSLWRRMSLDENVSDWEKSKVTVWEYPVEERYTKIYNAMKKTGFLLDIDQAVDSVRKINRTREFAYVGEAVPIKYLVLTNCDLKQVGEEFGRRPYAFAVKKGSPLKSEFDEAIRQAGIKGILEELKKKWWDENPARARCPADNTTDSGFTLNDVGAIFLIVLIGIILASVILCLQYCWHNVFAKKMQRETVPS